jgi:group II intron reverse transcriptase/maturase/CRISPR-associated endonuclease Cas1
MGELFDQVCSETILFDAWQRVERKGSQGGIDQITISEFRQRLQHNLERLRDDLLSGRYVPEPFQKLEIPKFDAPGETRPLQLPTVRDKIAQEAVRSIIAPILDKAFADCSYAYRPGKGPQKAIRRVEHYLEAKKHWVAMADIDRFFDTMDQELTLDEVKKHVPEPEILRLLALWIKMGAMDSRGRWVDPLRGVAQGSVISPLLSNLYLTPFDTYLTQKDYALVRYADNIILLGPSAEAVRQALDEGQAFLEQRLKLQLNVHPRPVAPLDAGFVFLGIYFRGNTRRISNGKIDQMKAEIRSLWHRRTALEVPQLIDKLNESIVGWKRYYGMIKPDEQFRELDAYVAEGLARALAMCMAAGRLSRDVDPYDMIKPLEFLQEIPPAQHKGAIWRIVRRFRDLRNGTRAVRERHEETTLTEVQPGESPKAVQEAETPAPGATTRQSSNTPTQPVSSTPESVGAAQSPASEKAAEAQVGQAVRRQKRRYLRQAAQGAELVISEPGVFLGRTSRRIVVKKQRRVIMEIPLKQLRHIIVATPGVTLPSAVIAACAEQQVPIDFLTPRGEPLARLHTPLDSLGNTGLQQLKAVHDGSGLKLARTIVYGKLKNQLNLVKYYHKYRRRVDQEFSRAFDEVEQKFDRLMAEVQHFVPAGDYDDGRQRLFAFEGQGGNLYWQMIRLLLDDDVEFAGRERQGATDMVNSLLNYSYGMLYPWVHHALMLAGLNPCISFLHSFQEDKPTLSFDLIEEFRAQAVDRVVFGMINKGERLEIDPKTGRLTKETVQKLIQNVLERLATPVRYRRQDKPLQEIIQLQAKLLAAHLHGKARYRPFIRQW